MAALIPVRKGSQRVKNKNIRPFSSTSLLEIKIQQLKRIKEIDEIVVNSDCRSMLEIARNMGAKTVLRDTYYASSTVPMNEVWKNLAENVDCEYILYTNVTNPLFRDATYTKMIEKWNSLIQTEYDSITSVHELKEYIWDNENKPVNYDPNTHPRSQDLPLYYGLNFAASIIPRELMIERSSIIGKKFFPFFVDKIQCTDIDDNHDFMIAEKLYNTMVENERKI